MNRKEFYDKYGDVKVKFSSYWKYTFVFTGEVDGTLISVRVGGDSNGIYRFEVDANSVETVLGLMPYAGKCGQDEFYDF